MSKVYAVGLSFNPDIAVLRSTLSMLKIEVHQTYLYDNNSLNRSDVVCLADELSVCLVCGIDNIGVAGINIIVERAFEDGADFILVYDQDSILPIGYVKESIKTCLHNDRVVVVPAYIDKQRNVFGPAYKIGSYWVWKTKLETSDDRYVSTDIAIGSGMFISRKIWHTVDGFRESFFLDCVDIDFCFKARVAGFLFLYDTQAVMEHSIGDGVVNFFAIFKISKHTPYRHYLYVRNSLSLIGSSEAPLGWKLYQLPKVVIQMCIYSIVGTEAVENRRYFIKVFLELYLEKFNIIKKGINNLF